MPERDQFNQIISGLTKLHERVNNEAGGKELAPSEVMKLRLQIRRLLIGFPDWQEQEVRHYPGYGVDWNLAGNHQVNRLEEAWQRVPIEAINNLHFSDNTMFFLDKIIDLVVLPVITDQYGDDEVQRTQAELAFTSNKLNEQAVDLFALNVLRVNTLRFLIDNTDMLSFEGYGFDVMEPGYVETYGQENATYIVQLMKRIHLGHGRIFHYLGVKYKELALSKKMSLAATYQQTAALLLQLIVDPSNSGLRGEMETHLATAEATLLQHDLAVFEESLQLLGQEVDRPLGFEMDDSEVVEPVTDETIELFVSRYDCAELAKWIEMRKAPLANLKIIIRHFNDAKTAISRGTIGYSEGFLEYLWAIENEKTDLITRVTKSNEQVAEVKRFLVRHDLLIERNTKDRKEKIEEWKNAYPALKQLLQAFSNTPETTTGMD